MNDIHSIYDEIRQKRGDVANIHSAFSDFPIGVKAHFDFYNSILLSDNLPLSREEREFLAVKTSQANNCPYCIQHHETAYKKFESKSISETKLDSLSQLADTLTKEPWKSSAIKESFLSSGYREDQFQHAVMVVAYFNFANRCAHAMDLELEPFFEKSCT